MSFVDEAQIHVKAGNGGAGCVSFRREAHTPKGGPDGGDGGSGGDVILVADQNVSSLLAFADYPHRAATNGTHGKGKKKHGKRGDDMEVSVPEGTIVHDRDGTVLAELREAGDRWIAAYGGRGGRGNARFLNNARRAPSFAEQGEVGEEHYYNLELQLMADVALVGFPNAGKSTFISRVSAAKPKIADYPFTTLEPHLGVVKFDEHEFVMADIPGLIEGAAEGKGLGHKFLRHVEKARVLCVLLDLSSIERTPEEQQQILIKELGDYDATLLERPRLVVGSKSDSPEVELDDSIPTFSAMTGDGLKTVVGGLAELVQKARADVVVKSSFVRHEPSRSGVSVSRDASGDWLVSGKAAERAVALSDITNEQALEYIRRRLDRLGVEKALKKAGVKEGESVHIGSFVFEYSEDD